MAERTYLCIDLKSFYASVECRERGLDPLTTNLVVADKSRTEKTICLAVSPSLKSCGVPGRARLFEVIQKVREINTKRKYNAPGKNLIGASSDNEELKRNPALALDFIAAPPRMALYMEYSIKIYRVYLKHIAPEDIHVYSVDEVFIDLTSYLKGKNSLPRDFAIMIIQDVHKTTGITATAGIGTNMFLAKIAMDITAKKMPADKDGVRIAELDEKSFRETLWDHRPLTDFWRVGKGYATKLESYGMFTMGDVARCSIQNEDLLYKLFGVNAELLIDHAWGFEPCTIADIKAYKPQSNSISTGQVLTCPYDFKKTRLVVHEMADAMSLDLVERGQVTDQMTLTIGYDVECLINPEIRSKYHGEITTDHYGRQIPKNAHGTANLNMQTSSTKLIVDAVLSLFDRIVNKNLLVRRLNLTANHVIDENSIQESGFAGEQLSLFIDYEALEKKREEEKAILSREKNLQKTVIEIKNRYGKNAIVKGMNLQEGATAIERNSQIGGHKA